MTCVLEEIETILFDDLAVDIHHNYCTDKYGAVITPTETKIKFVIEF